MDVHELGGELQDPTGAIDNILKLISAGTGIPLRKLTGSERGELASTQDDDFHFYISLFPLTRSGYCSGCPDAALRFRLPRGVGRH